MTGERKSFTIKDRRLFTADGELRAEEPQEALPTEPEPPRPAPEQELEPEPVAHPEDVDFAGFVMSLGAQAFDALSAEPPALGAVRTLVSVLEMLRDKTQGRRTPEEDRVLDGLLYQLRLGYVERSKTGRA